MPLQKHVGRPFTRSEEYPPHVFAVICWKNNAHEDWLSVDTIKTFMENVRSNCWCCRGYCDFYKLQLNKNGSQLQAWFDRHSKSFNCPFTVKFPHAKNRTCDFFHVHPSKASLNRCQKIDNELRAKQESKIVRMGGRPHRPKHHFDQQEYFPIGKPTERPRILTKPSLADTFQSKSDSHLNFEQTASDELASLPADNGGQWADSYALPERQEVTQEISLQLIQKEEKGKSLACEMLEDDNGAGNHVNDDGFEDDIILISESTTSNQKKRIVNLVEDEDEIAVIFERTRQNERDDTVSSSNVAKKDVDNSFSRSSLFSFLGQNDLLRRFEREIEERKKQVSKCADFD